MFEGLISLGRQMRITTGKRGALIQLEGNVAYLINEKRSVLYKIVLKSKGGTGTFYSIEAPLETKCITRRSDKVVFNVTRDGVTQYIFVPNRAPIAEEAEEVLAKYFVKPEIRVPADLLLALNPDILVTKIFAEGNELRTEQIRSDGSVSFENILKLGRGLIQANYPPQGPVSFFTGDLNVLKNYVLGPLYLAPKQPMSVSAKLKFGELVGIISHMTYER